MAILGHDDGHGLADIVDFSLSQGRQSRALQDRLHAFQPRTRMNFEALREQSDSILDVTAGPSSGNTIESEGLLDINTADERVGMSAAHDRGMQHVWKANIAHVDAASGKKATRLMGLTLRPMNGVEVLAMGLPTRYLAFIVHSIPYSCQISLYPLFSTETITKIEARDRISQVRHSKELRLSGPPL